MLRALIALVLLLSPTVSLADQFSDAVGRYRVLPSSRIHFSVAQLGGEGIEGEFTRFKGTLQLDRNVGRSKVEFSLEPGSVKTVDPRIDEFIRSEPVFDVANHPIVRFLSTGVKRTGDTSASIDGQLSAKGVTRQTQFTVTFKGQTAKTLKFHVTGKMSRALFNMDVGIPIYSNRVVLDMELVGQRM